MEDSQKIVSYDSLNRTVKILNSPEADLSKLASVIMKIGRHKVQNLMRKRPRKAKEAKDLIRWLENKLAKLTPPDLELKQIITDWEGRQIGPYRLKIPTQLKDLTCAGTELGNCLESMLTKVLRKETQLLTLEQEGKLELAVDLIPTPEGWRVKDILGKNNDAEFQGRKGLFIRREL